MNYFGTEIFWASLAALIAILSMSVIIGRWACDALPRALQIYGKFYLSPILGLVILLFFATAFGWLAPFGGNVMVPIMVTILLIIAIKCQSNPTFILQHALIVSLFGVACAASILVPLYAFGGFNAHNDTSTYLAHARWLQEHAFRDKLSAKTAVAPYSSQIYLYQVMNLRMGSSFLLAMFQALLNASSAYVMYPAVAMSAVASCCLAIGMPLAKVLRKLSRTSRLMLLALPAFTLGGLVTGAESGFLPQTFGLALGGASLFMAGPTLIQACEIRSWASTAKLALPLMLLLTGAVFAYSEIAPFLVMVLACSWLYVALRSRQWTSLIRFAIACTILTLLLLNFEILRAYNAIRLQSGVVVGNAVDWPVLGFLIHAAGFYAGDTQLPFPGYAILTASLGTGVVTFLVIVTICALIWAGYRVIARMESRQVIFPTIIMLAILSVSFAYFRYVAANPFLNGEGQSWDQFKISDWAHPFAMALVLSIIGNVLTKFKKIPTLLIKITFVAGLTFSSWHGLCAIRPLTSYYKSHNINKLYSQLREATLSDCPGRIYIALPAYYQSFRRIASVFLYDRDVASDWTGDAYMQTWVSLHPRAEQPHNGDCVLEYDASKRWTREGQRIGAFWLGHGPLSEGLSVTSVSGAYPRESDATNSWYWVNHSVQFNLDSRLVTRKEASTHIRFEYASVSGQRLTLNVSEASGRRIAIALPTHGFPLTTYDGVVDLPAADVVKLTIETADSAVRLSASDPRTASFIIRNLVVEAQQAH